MAFRFGSTPSILVTSPFPKRRCSTRIPASILLAEAANLGNLDQYSIQNYPKQDMGGLSFMLGGASALIGSQTPSVLNHPMLEQSIRSIENITSSDNIQTRMPFDLYVY